MGFGFRHVLMDQWGQASELKPHLLNNDDLWKKNGHSKYWKPPHSYHIVPILAWKSSFQYRYLEGSKQPVLQNLSLIYIFMRIHEKKFTHQAKFHKNRTSGSWVIASFVQKTRHYHFICKCVVCNVESGRRKEWLQQWVVSRWSCSNTTTNRFICEASGEGCSVDDVLCCVVKWNCI